MTPILKRVTRLDSMPVKEAFYTEEGYLKDQPILTSTGIFEYANPDGSIRRELRLPEDVFDPESLASFEGKPIIVTHDAGLVNKDNVHEYQIGTILSEGFRDGQDVKAKIIIHDTAEMKKSGLKELSLGYSLDLDETSGVWNGRHYDAIQRNIRINHLALVGEARAGEQARLNIDSKDGITLKGGKLMSKVIRRHGRRNDEALSPEELQKAIEWYKANRDTIEGGQGSAPAAKPEEKPEEKKAASIEEQIGSIRENHPIEKDSEEEKAPFVLPEKKPEEKAVEEEEFEKDADEVIKDQDKDIKTLLDIIDTLLAERAFDEADEVIPDKKKAEVLEDIQNEDDADEDIPDFEEEDLREDEGEEEELPEDEDEEIIIEEEEENTDEDDDIFEEKEQLLNTDSVDKIVRERIKLGMIGRQLNLDGLENVSIMTAKKAIIKTVRPKVRLDGKSKAYINALFDCAVEDVRKNTRKDTNYQRKQMFNKDSARRDDNKDSSMSHRDRMIERQRNKKEGK